MSGARSLFRRAAVAAVVAAAADPLLRPVVSGRPRWIRHNFRQQEVLLSGGPAVAAGALVGVAVAPAVPGAVVAAATAATLGLYDDLYGDRHARGLRGHARALREGRVTTGMVKLVGLAAGGLAAGLLARRRLAPALVDAALVAGTANLVNLLDLRPGRALKVCLVTGAVTAGTSAAGAAAAAAAGAAAGVLRTDLREIVMIGDCGANTLGALLGWSVASGTRPATRAAALGVVVALTLVSERVSFTEVIASTPWLRALDEAGRR